MHQTWWRMSLQSPLIVKQEARVQISNRDVTEGGDAEGADIGQKDDAEETTCVTTLVEEGAVELNVAGVVQKDVSSSEKSEG